MTIQKIFKIKFAYVTNDTAETSIKTHIYHFTAPHEMVICESDGVTGTTYRTNGSNINFFNKLLANI
jgi:hypothetical protein